MREITILGVPFAALTPDEALTQMENWLDEPKNHIVVTPNPEGVMQARRNAELSAALLGADLRLADGVGILLASRYMRRPLPGRVRGVDTIFGFFERLNKKDRKFTVYFLGAKPGVAEEAKRRMEEKYPCMEVVGFHHGFFAENSDDEREILTNINKLQPDILLVCVGMPRAEIWANKHREINARLTLCLGGTLDIMGGNVKLAPPFLRKIGLEWLYRLCKQPSRFWRQLDIPRFMWAVVTEVKHDKK